MIRRPRTGGDAARGAWRLLLSGAAAGVWNMALDEALLAEAGALPAQGPGTRGPTLRLYRWEPACVSLGRFQDVAPSEIQGWRARGVDVVRRPTGGGAIHHGAEVTWSIVLPAGHPVAGGTTREVYERLHAAIARGLASIGVEVRLRGSDGGPVAGPPSASCFERAAPFDLVLGGRKVVGSAMRRMGGAVLVHGAIPTGPSPIAPSAAWVARPASAVEAAVVEGFEAALGVRFDRGEVCESERRQACDLAGARYGDEAWTLGGQIPLPAGGEVVAASRSR